MEILAMALLMMFGITLGWVMRSITFVHDRDCANPAHKR